MTGICDEGHIVNWRNTRGSRKPEQCPRCMSPVHMARYNPNVPGHYEKANSSGRPNTQLLPCVVCGRKRRVPSGNAKRLQKDLTLKVWGKNGYERFEAKTGDVVCWSHQTWEGNYVSLTEGA